MGPSSGSVWENQGIEKPPASERSPAAERGLHGGKARDRCGLPRPCHVGKRRQRFRTAEATGIMVGISDLRHYRMRSIPTSRISTLVLSSGGAREVCAHPVNAWKQTPKTTSLTPRTGGQRAFANAKREAGCFLVANGPSWLSMAPFLS